MCESWPGHAQIYPLFSKSDKDDYATSQSAKTGGEIEFLQRYTGRSYAYTHLRARDTTVAVFTQRRGGD